ncbi:MAG: transporter [Isosphaeraceae bacterium]|jgi:uncharacterized integral membrane protein (TIGR00697 family)|nr:MAG: transporter [Isosphaeraceae bacterium]
MTLPSPPPEPSAAPTAHHATREPYRYYEFILAAFVTVLLCTNLISASKQVSVFGRVVGAGVLFFPISYLFGDILTEVYGYARSRRVVWCGFAALAFAALVTQVVLGLPPAPGWQFMATTTDGSPVSLPRQAAWETVFGSTWRIVIASMLGFFAGEFANSYTLAKMKLATRGRWLWTRTIGSTIVGEAVDSLLFYPIAFLGVWTTERVIEIMASNYLLKVGWEVLATPLTYRVVRFLKTAEGVDHFDDQTNFTPFSLET